MLQSVKKSKLEVSLENQDHVHYALQVNDKQHIICLFPQRIINKKVQCKIVRCECVNKDKDRHYVCNYYSVWSIMLERNQVVYNCGCGSRMYLVLEENINKVLKQTTGE